VTLTLTVAGQALTTTDPSVVINGTAGAGNVFVAATAQGTYATALTLASAELVAGQSYVAQVTVQDSATHAVSNLSTSDFSATLGSTGLSITSATQTTSTSGIYNVTFVAPAVANATGQNLTFAVDGVTATSISGVTVGAIGTATGQSSWVINTAAGDKITGTSVNAGSTNTLADLTLKDNASTPNSLIVPTSAFKVTYGTSTTNLVNAVSYSSGKYTIQINDPNTVNATATGFTVSVDGVVVSGPSTGNSFTVTGATSAATYNSSVSFPSGTSLVAGKKMTMNVSLSDAYGNPITGLTSVTSFKLGTTDLTATGTYADYAFAAGTTAGTYTITFDVPYTASATAQALQLVIAGAIFNSTGNYTVANGTYAAGVDNGATTAGYTAGTAIGTSITEANAGSFAAGTYSLTVSVVDAYGNPVTSLPAGGTVKVYFVSGTGNSNTVSYNSTTVGSSSATATTINLNSSGQATLSYAVTTDPTTTNDTLYIIYNGVTTTETIS
jgi:adhesin/invasin